MGVDIRDLVVLASGDGPVVLAITGSGGGMISLRFANGQLQQFDEVSFSDAMRGEVTGFSAMLGQGNNSFVVLGDTRAGEVVGFALNGEGGIDAAAASSLPIYVGNSGPVVATSAEGFIYTTTDAGRLQGVSEQGNGYRAIANFRDTDTTYAVDPVALEVVEIAGVEYLVTLSAGDVGLSSFLINPQNGALSHVVGVGTATGLGLLANPTDMQIVTTQGGTFAVVSSASSGGEGGRAHGGRDWRGCQHASGRSHPRQPRHAVWHSSYCRGRSSGRLDLCGGRRRGCRPEFVYANTRGPSAASQYDGRYKFRWFRDY